MLGAMKSFNIQPTRDKEKDKQTLLNKLKESGGSLNDAQKESISNLKDALKDDNNPQLADVKDAITTYSQKFNSVA
jgi:hypothetical protein